jgi:replication factor C large subunit
LDASVEPWTRKHRPLNRDGIVGNGGSVRRAYEWLRDWERSRKAILLHGPPGVGKTATIEVVAHELGYSVIEMNASDVRTEARINEVMLPAISSKALSGNKRLFLLDEVDGIQGRSDSGGVGALLKAVESKSVPVAMTANDPWDNDLRVLRGKVEMVEFRRVSPPEIAGRLREICTLEGVVVDDAALLDLADASGGDVRSAIEDLQTSLIGGRYDEAVASLLGLRQREEKLFETLNGIFNASSVVDARRALDSSSENYEDVFEWIYEYLPKVLANAQDLEGALEYLGKADVILRRIKRANDWSQLPYYLELLSAGTALSRSSLRVSGTYYRERPDRLRNRWKYFSTSKKLESSGLSLSHLLHGGVHRMRVDIMPLYRIAAKSKGGANMARALNDVGVEF